MSSSPMGGYAEILPQLREKWASYLRHEITSVRFGQEPGRCYLEIHTLNRIHSCVDEAMTRTDLGFISDGDDESLYFDSSRPLRENVMLFLEEFGEYNILQCTDLFRPEVAELIQEAQIGAAGEKPKAGGELSTQRLGNCASRTIEPWDLKYAKADEMLPTVEVDTHDSHQLASACVYALGTSLPAIARSARVTIYTYEGPSVNFGRVTNSIFFAIGGPERVLSPLHATLCGVQGVDVRWGEQIHARSCRPILHSEKGSVWTEGDDADVWEAFSTVKS